MTNEWMDWSEQAVGAAMDAVGYLSKEWCDYADLQTHENANGENYVFVEDQSGNKQFVGRIQAEVSDSKTFLMCHPVNKTCPNNYYCKNTLCYKDEFATTPEKGYLHKIEWGVTAPQDSKATPFVDENNKAVKFNVMLSYKGIETPLYLRSNYNKYEVIQLTNGESDKGIVLMYLGDIADKACVKFSDTAYPTDRYGKGRVNEICANIVGIAKTGVDFTDTDAGSTPSFTVQGGKVSQNSNLW